MGKRCRRCNGRGLGQCFGLSLGHVSHPFATSSTIIAPDVQSRVKTRLQVQGKRKPAGQDSPSTHTDHYDSTMDAMSKIVADEGITGLYSGVNGALLGVDGES